MSTVVVTLLLGSLLGLFLMGVLRTITLPENATAVIRQRLEKKREVLQLRHISDLEHDSERLASCFGHHFDLPVELQARLLPGPPPQAVKLTYVLDLSGLLPPSFQWSAHEYVEVPSFEADSALRAELDGYLADRMVEMICLPMDVTLGEGQMILSWTENYGEHIRDAPILACVRAFSEPQRWEPEKARAAAERLGHQVDNTTAEQLLIRLLDHENTSVVTAAVLSLLKVGTMQSVKSLEAKKKALGRRGVDVAEAVGTIVQRVKTGQRGELSVASTKSESGALSEASERGLMDTPLER